MTAYFPRAPFRWKPRAALALILAISLPLLSGIAGAATNPRLTPVCARTENIVVNGGFEHEAETYLAPCPCILLHPWGTNQSGKGGTTAQMGWGTEGRYAAVVSLDDSAAGDWASLSQSVVGDQYCALNFTYSMWLSGGRESDLSVYMDNGLIWSTHELVQGMQPMKREVTVDVSSFSGYHTIRFLQKATRGGTGHSDWFIDDVRLMAGSFTPPELETPPPATTISTPFMTPRPNTTTMTPARPLVARNETPSPTISTVTMTTVRTPALNTVPATPRPTIARPAPFNPVKYLTCLARRIHDEVFPFIPLKGGVDPGCT